MRRAVRFGLSALLAIGAAAPATTFSAIEGHWSGAQEGLTLVRLTFEENDGQLRGGALFFMIHRVPGKPAEATPGYAEPMIDPVFDGKAVTFAINHRYAHPPGSLDDPPVSFRFELTGADSGRLMAPELPPFPMTREKYH